MHHSFSPGSLLAVVAVVATALAAPTAAVAQNIDRLTPPATIVFSDNLFKLDSIGFSMPMPVGSHMVLDQFGTQIAQGFLFPPDRSWKIRVETVLSEQGRVTLDEFTEHVMNKLLLYYGRAGADGKAEDSAASIILHEQNLIIPLGVATRYYARYPERGGREWFVRGRTFVQMIAKENLPDETGVKFRTDRYLVLTLECKEENFAKARPIYELLVSAATVIDPAVLSRTRGAKVRAGVAFLAGLTPDDFEAVIGRGIDRWERLYVPGPTGARADDRELGFRRTRISRGALADIPELNGPGGKGYIVRIEARLFVPDHRAILESESVFFVSADFSRETWFVKTAAYNDSTHELMTRQEELGGRIDERMNVAVTGKGMPRESIKPLIEGEGYISRALVWLLPPLLVHKQAQADYGFYHYRSTTRGITFREDSLDRDPTNPDIWLVTSRISEDDPPQITSLGPDGRLLSTDLSEGRVWVPIELSELRRLWDRKGLPTSALGKRR